MAGKPSETGRSGETISRGCAGKDGGGGAEARRDGGRRGRAAPRGPKGAERGRAARPRIPDDEARLWPGSGHPRGRRVRIERPFLLNSGSTGVIIRLGQSPPAPPRAVMSPPLSLRFVRVFGTAFLPLVTSGMLFGCQSASCGDLTEEEVQIYSVRCGIDFFNDGPCDENQRRILACTNSCGRDASCAALRGEDAPDTPELRACYEYCDYFTGFLPTSWWEAQ